MTTIVNVPCFCGGDNPSCPKCDGSNLIPKIACVRCYGTGYTAAVAKAGNCVDCRGLGYREIDNEVF